jgi:hypothetical protein
MASETLDLDTVKPSDIESSVDGVVVNRGFTIRYPTTDPLSTAPRPIGTGQSDPGLLLNALGFLVGQGCYVGAPFPQNPSSNIVNGANLLLTRINFTSWSADNKMLGGRLTYYTPLINGTDSKVISFNADFTTGTSTTTSTFNGQNNITAWYSNAYTGSTLPSGAIPQSVDVQKYVSTGTLIVVIPFPGTFWNVVSPNYTTINSFINSTTWGSYARGTWIYNGCNPITKDFGNSYIVTFTFQYDPYGWYPVGEYLDPAAGIPPADRATVSSLLALGPPSVGGLVNRNGLVRASVQGETDFNALFTPYFTPNGIT